MDERRTNPGFLSDDEAKRDRERTEDMVRGIVAGKGVTNMGETSKPDSSKNASFEPDEKFWETWRGRIVRAIVLNGAYTKDAILKNTSLGEKQFEQAVKELLDNNLLEEMENRPFWVKRDLYGKCQIFFDGLQETLAGWVK